MRAQTTYLGFLQLKPNVLTDPVALVPDGYKRANVMLLYKKEGGFRATYLLDLDYDQLGGLAAVEDALRGSKPGDPAAVDEALQEPKDGKESPLLEPPRMSRRAGGSSYPGCSGKLFFTSAKPVLLQAPGVLE